MHLLAGDGDSCQDINECTQAGPPVCPPVGANCTNTRGSFECKCATGYTGDGAFCTDIVECVTPEDNACSENAHCTNTAGAYGCLCKAGFTGDGYTCSNVNECSAASTCASNAICNNTLGSYTCSCPFGHDGDGHTVCNDIDECLRVGICAGNAACRNVVGSYRCACLTGFTGDSHSNCSDINECEEASSLHNCDLAVGECINEVGAFKCSCPVGYSGDGTVCEDVNECEQTMDACLQGADCVNTNGSYSCPCLAGYREDGALCTEVNECWEGTHSCHALFGTCINLNGSYECTCREHFAGDGVECASVDHCVTGTHNCSRNARCSTGDETTAVTMATTTPAAATTAAAGTVAALADSSFNCQCLPGYFGDGYVCNISTNAKSGQQDAGAQAMFITGVGALTCVVVIMLAAFFAYKSETRKRPSILQQPMPGMSSFSSRKNDVDEHPPQLQFDNKAYELFLRYGSSATSTDDYTTTYHEEFQLARADARSQSVSTYTDAKPDRQLSPDTSAHCQQAEQSLRGDLSCSAGNLSQETSNSTSNLTGAMYDERQGNGKPINTQQGHTESGHRLTNTLYAMCSSLLYSVVGKKSRRNSATIPVTSSPCWSNISSQHDLGCRYNVTEERLVANNHSGSTASPLGESQAEDLEHWTSADGDYLNVFSRRPTIEGGGRWASRRGSSVTTVPLNEFEGDYGVIDDLTRANSNDWNPCDEEKQYSLFSRHVNGSTNDAYAVGSAAAAAGGGWESLDSEQHASRAAADELSSSVPAKSMQANGKPVSIDLDGSYESKNNSGSTTPLTVFEVSMTEAQPDVSTVCNKHALFDFSTSSQPLDGASDEQVCLAAETRLAVSATQCGHEEDAASPQKSESSSVQVTSSGNQVPSLLLKTKKDMELDTQNCVTVAPGGAMAVLDRKTSALIRALFS
ncbi:uncharacterized protein LOC135821805 [Sycon ciliatum]|uniref:uncharacterized protein LOC135821805 n=1 Tax=Sycon ciliatum TaxID=27933 RepID=UPI0031F6F44C